MFLFTHSPESTVQEECSQLLALIRVSSVDQLDDSTVQKSARSRLEQLLDAGAIGALDEKYLEQAEEILGIVSTYDISSVRIFLKCLSQDLLHDSNSKIPYYLTNLI